MCILPFGQDPELATTFYRRSPATVDDRPASGAGTTTEAEVECWVEQQVSDLYLAANDVDYEQTSGHSVGTAHVALAEVGQPQPIG